MAGRICKAVIARLYVLLTIEALISSHRFLYLTNSDDLYRPIISYLAGCKMHRNAFSKLPSGGFPDIIDVMKAERVSGKDAYTVYWPCSLYAFSPHRMLRTNQLPEASKML